MLLDRFGANSTPDAHPEEEPLRAATARFVAAQRPAPQNAKLSEREPASASGAAADPRLETLRTATRLGEQQRRGQQVAAVFSHAGVSSAAVADASEVSVTDQPMRVTEVPRAAAQPATGKLKPKVAAADGDARVQSLRLALQLRERRQRGHQVAAVFSLAPPTDACSRRRAGTGGAHEDARGACDHAV